MSYVSNYIVCARSHEHHAFENLCKSLDAAMGDGSTKVTSDFCVHNGKALEANVMIFALNYAVKKDFLEAVRNVDWRSGLETVQVFYCGPNNTLFENITDWDVIDYC
jgi:hypothetical protein